MREKRPTANTRVGGEHYTDAATRTAGRQNAGQDELLHRASVAGLTHRFTHRHTIILRLKIVPVASAAAIYKAHALSLGEVEVPTGHHGPAGTRHRLLGADSCVKTVRMSAGQRQQLRTCHNATDARAGPGGEGGLADSSHQPRLRPDRPWWPWLTSPPLQPGTADDAGRFHSEALCS